jgi:hypothetical protein
VNCRLTDNEDRLWLMRYIKEVAKSRLGADLDATFKHLASSAQSGVGLEELRAIFFGDYMDIAADMPSARVYDEAQVGSAPKALCLSPCRIGLEIMMSPTEESGNVACALRHFTTYQHEWQACSCPV